MKTAQKLSHYRVIPPASVWGALGYVAKEDAFQELPRALRAVMANKTYVSPSMAGRVVEDFVKVVESAASGFPLSPREREVLRLVADGKATKQVALLLKISVKTVETHRRSIMEKLQLDGVANLTKYAIRAGITSVDSQ